MRPITAKLLMPPFVLLALVMGFVVYPTALAVRWCYWRSVDLLCLIVHAVLGGDYERPRDGR